MPRPLYSLDCLVRIPLCSRDLAIAGGAWIFGNPPVKKRTGGKTISKRTSLTVKSRSKTASPTRAKRKSSSSTGDGATVRVPKSGRKGNTVSLKSVSRPLKTAAKSSIQVSGKPSPAQPKNGSKSSATRTAGAGKAKRVPVRRRSPVATDVGSTALSWNPAFPDPSRPLPKTRLTPKHLLEFKELLIAKRTELAGDVKQLTDEAFNRNSQGEHEHTSMPIHMADLGSDNWEQDFTLGLIASERALVQEIDEALVRIEDRTFGNCLATRHRIRLARLRAKPWAKYCVEHASAIEDGRPI